jgi:hypothetical protein
MIGHRFGKLRKHTQVIEYDGIVGLFLFCAFDPGNPVQTLDMPDAAAKTIDGIRWEDHQPAVAERFHSMSYLAWGRIFFIDSDDHGPGMYRERN